MRVPVIILVAASAILLLAFTGFSQIAAIPVVLGSVVVMLARWNSKRSIGLAGFTVAAAGAGLAGNLTDMTDVIQIVEAGFLLVLPLSLLFWNALSTGELEEETVKIGVSPYIVAAAFCATLLAAVPIAGNVFPSLRLTGAPGISTTVMMLGFVAAIWSVAIFGRSKD